MRFVGGNFFALLIVSACEFMLLWLPIEFLQQGVAGKVLLVATLSRFVGGVLSLGVPSANVYFLNAINDRYSKDRLVLVNLFHIFAVFAVFAPILLVIGNYFLDSFLPQIGFLDYCFLVLISSLRAVALLNQSLFQSRGDFKSYNFLQLKVVLLSVVFGGAALLNDLGEYWFLGGVALSNLLGGIFGLINNTKLEKINFTLLKNIGGFYKYGWTSYLNNLVALAVARTDLYVISLFLGAAAVPAYNLASLFGEKVSLISQSIGAVLFPHLSKKSECFDVSVFSKSLRLTIVYSIYFNILLVVVLFSALNLMFSSGFEIVPLLFFLLIPGFLCRSVSSICAIALNSINKPYLNYRISILVLIINIVLTVAMVKDYGLIGAAISTSIAHLCNFIIRLLTVRYCLPEFYLLSACPKVADWLHIKKISLARFKFW